MNNLSNTSYLDQSVVTEPLAVPDAIQTFSGTGSDDFSSGNSMEQGQPSARLKDSNTQPETDSLIFDYQPVNQASIIPVHQLLF